MNRQKRLAALNGDRRTFVCWECGRVKHVKDAAARNGRNADLLCNICVCYLSVLQGVREHIDALFSLPRRSVVGVTVTLPCAVKKIRFRPRFGRGLHENTIVTEARKLIEGGDHE